VHIGRLVHHVLSREIVAALFKDINHRLRQTVSAKGEDVARIAVREVPFHKRDVVKTGMAIDALGNDKIRPP